MIVTKKHIKMQHDVFIDNIYTIYHTLHSINAFTKEGVETQVFKAWKHNDDYFILNKVTGQMFTWYKLLGWNLSSNDSVKAEDFERFCQILKDDLIANDIMMVYPEDFQER